MLGEVQVQVVDGVRGRRLATRPAPYIGSGLADGTFRPVIAETFDGLDRIQDAHRLMESNTHTGKIVVKIQRAARGPVSADRRIPE